MHRLVNNKHNFNPRTRTLVRSLYCNVGTLQNLGFRQCAWLSLFQTFSCRYIKQIMWRPVSLLILRGSKTTSKPDPFQLEHNYNHGFQSNHNRGLALLSGVHTSPLPIPDDKALNVNRSSTSRTFATVDFSTRPRRANTPQSWLEFNSTQLNSTLRQLGLNPRISVGGRYASNQGVHKEWGCVLRSTLSERIWGF